MNFDVVNYDILTSKLISKEKISTVLIADLHNYTSNRKNAGKLIEAILSLSPHHVIIAGDILGSRLWNNKKALNNLQYFLRELSNGTYIILSLGNHDIKGINKFKELKNINPNKIYPLVDDAITIDNFEIVGYLSKDKSVDNLDIQLSGIAHDRFIEDFNNTDYTFSQDKIVEFAGHNPHLIAEANKVSLGKMKNIDTFYAGHLHNGYIRSKKIKNNPSKYLDNGYVERIILRDKNNRIIFQSHFLKTNLCRGVIYLDDSAKQILLQLRDGSFYINKDKWENINIEEARNKIINDKLHALVITGGIRKFFYLDIDYPEITKVNYIGFKE